MDLQLLSQCGSTSNCLCRSVPEIHSHVAGTLSNQPTNKNHLTSPHLTSRHSPARWGRRGDMRDALCASLLQPARSSAFLIRVGVSILVHSLMLSSQLFACRPRFRPPSNVPCRMVLGRLLWRVTWPNHVSFLLLMVARRGSCGPALDVTWARTKSLVLRSCL